MDAFVAAKYKYTGRKSAIRVIVVHCTVSPEMGSGAEDVARYFANIDRKASVHKVADNDSVVTCVADDDTAFGAAGANADGLHLELVGMPQQSRDEWLDDYGLAEFAQARTVLADWSALHGIPLRWLSLAELADGVTKGVTTHVDCEAVWPAFGHWDPGPDFPRDVFLDPTTTPAGPPAAQEDPDMPRPAIVKDASGQIWTFHRGAQSDCIASFGGHVWSLGGQFTGDLEATPHDGGIIIVGVGADGVMPFAKVIYPGNVADAAGADKPDTDWFPLG